MPRILALLACCAALACGTVLAACSSSAATVGPSRAAASGTAQASAANPSASIATSASATASATASPSPSPSPTAAPSASPSPEPSASQAAAPCKPTTKAGAVRVKIVDFDFKPASIRARVGQVIRFTNSGFEPHAVTLDTEDCETPTLETGNSAGLLFSAAGSFPFHCAIHSWMTGTITVRR